MAKCELGEGRVERILGIVELEMTHKVRKTEGICHNDVKAVP
jgi:hypothetical protein